MPDKVIIIDIFFNFPFIEVTVSKLSPLSEETPSRLVSLQNSPVKRTRAPPSASAVSEDDVFLADSRWIILKNSFEEALYFAEYSPAPVVIDKAHPQHHFFMITLSKMTEFQNRVVRSNVVHLSPGPSSMILSPISLGVSYRSSNRKAIGSVDFFSEHSDFFRGFHRQGKKGGLNGVHLIWLAYVTVRLQVSDYSQLSDFNPTQ